MSYIIIDRELLQMVGHVETLGIADMIQAVYYKDIELVVADVRLKSSGWTKLTQGEIATILRHHTGQVTEDAQYSEALNALLLLAQNFPMQNVNIPALEYSYGIMRESSLTPPPIDLVTESTPRAKAPEGAPSPKGATGRVWAIADECLAKAGHTDLNGINLKDLRKSIIDACTSAGINEATAGTQWSKWKKSKESA